MDDFKSALTMMLGFLLIIATALTEANRTFALSDFGMLILVMVLVSVIPAIAKPIYFWMIAENVEESERDVIRRKREIIVKVTFGIASLAMIIRLIGVYL